MVPIYVCYAIIVVFNAQDQEIRNVLYVEINFINGKFKQFVTICALLVNILLSINPTLLTKHNAIIAIQIVWLAKHIIIIVQRVLEQAMLFIQVGEMLLFFLLGMILSLNVWTIARTGLCLLITRQKWDITGVIEH